MKEYTIALRIDDARVVQYRSLLVQRQHGHAVHVDNPHTTYYADGCEWASANSSAMPSMISLF